ncbi:MAG: pyruvate, phosphate dikinase [Chloroflexota bacterium]
MTFALDILDLPTDPQAARAIAGGKAANLAIMARDLGLPVPPAFVITTATCRAFLTGGGWPDDLDDEIRRRMAALEATVGRRFGDPDGPLLVSVRSGAPVSMPGMMDTILNLGLPSGGTALDDPFTAALRGRLVAGFRDIVGIEAVPDDPWVQLRLAIEAVFRSWQGDRARAYRQKEGIADDLGTAVTVQAMVFGNRGPSSATGVLFTRDPATGEPELYGDVLFDAQGEDVVAGTHRTEPIAVLDERLPAVAAQLQAHADRLEHHFADLCDIEFTIEQGRLWMLQVRVGKRSPQAALRIAVAMAEDPDFPLSRAEAVARVRSHLVDPPTVTSTAGGDRPPPIATGLPASPGVASGPIVTSPEAAVEAAEQGRAPILVRAETSPDDVHGMARTAGILTATGGLASHAAVVARGWGIPAVVGAAAVTVHDGRIAIGERIFAAGEVITIDGGSGEVFVGSIAGSSEVVPEAATLIRWARELGISIDEMPVPDDDRPVATTPPPAAPPTRTVSPDRCLQAIAIKGFALPAAVADALLAAPDDVAPVLDRLVSDGLVGTAAGALKLTETGTARAAELLATDRAKMGADAAVAALDDFLALDRRMKDTVTAWQIRDAATGALNDHDDADYDQGVLRRLEALHGEAVAWIHGLTAAPPRLADYRERLERAVTAAIGGDGRFVASPRVDSYHGVWFELHEDLIALAGRTRADEVEAGRA